MAPAPTSAPAPAQDHPGRMILDPCHLSLSLFLPATRACASSSAQSTDAASHLNSLLCLLGSCFSRPLCLVPSYRHDSQRPVLETLGPAGNLGLRTRDTAVPLPCRYYSIHLRSPIFHPCCCRGRSHCQCHCHCRCQS